MTDDERRELFERFRAADANQQCWKSSKRRFARKRDAKRRAREAERSSGRRINVYRCPYCHDWHLTKKSQRKRKEQNR